MANATVCLGTPVDGQQLGIAFGLVIGAGAATGLGAAVPMLLELPCACCARWRGRKSLDRVLAAGLAFAAGVMMYVSFVEIFASKGVDAFASCVGPALGDLYGSLSFFGGMLVAWLLMRLVHGLQHCVGSTAQRRRAKLTIEALEEADVEAHMNESLRHIPRSSSSDDLTRDAPRENQQGGMVISLDDEFGKDEVETVLAVENAEGASRARLVLMTAFAAIAIALHNFPEGLATFVSAASDIQVGAVLAVAIVIHNIPEGAVVSIPIYHITKSKWKALVWGTLSGLTEPLGALFGWAVLGNLFNGIVYGILFCLVAGMMVYVSLRELLPVAHRYDPGDRVVTWSWVSGMALMALSLVLFQF